MNIAIVAHLKYPIAEPYAGGLEMHTHMLAEKLRQRGQRVTLFASDGSEGPNVVRMGRPTGSLEGNPVDAMTIAAVEHSAYGKIIELLQRGNFDIVHFNALHYLPLVHARDFGAPVVAVLHTPPVPSLGGSDALRIGTRALYRGLDILGDAMGGSRVATDCCAEWDRSEALCLQGDA